MHISFALMKKIISFLFIFLIASCHLINDKKTISTNDDSLQNVALIQDLKNNLSKSPDSADLRLKLVFALDSINKPREALQQIDSLILNDSLNYSLWFTKGQLAENAEDTMLALHCYASAAKIYESPDALLSLANLYAETKNERALTICSRLKLLGQGKEINASCDFIIGIYYARTHQAESAISFFNNCISENYTYMEAYIEKGLVYFDIKKYREALDVFNFAITVNRLYADAYYYQGRCFEMLNKKDSAILKFQQSLILDKNLAAAKEHLKYLNKD